METYIKDYQQYFKKVYERNVDSIYKICFIYLRGNKANAEDAIQTTFLNMFKNETSFESLEHEKAWLITTATNTCKNILKSKWNKNISIDELNLDNATSHSYLKVDAIRSICKRRISRMNKQSSGKVSLSKEKIELISNFLKDNFV
jgi:DNA-directed RNA polymerase specialized sigma24 family protein